MAQVALFSVIKWLPFQLTKTILLALALVAEALPPLQALERALANNPELQQRLIVLTVGLSAAGVLLVVGTQFVVRVGDERRWSSGGASDRAGTAPRRRSLGRGAGFSDEMTFAEVKQAWRNHAWRDQPRWQRFFLMALGALTLILGQVGLWFVLGPNVVRLLMSALLGYAIVRTVDGFRRA
jgi:hypothetical protein